jgi:hypothetical protein
MSRKMRVYSDGIVHTLDATQAEDGGHPRTAVACGMGAANVQRAHVLFAFAFQINGGSLHEVFVRPVHFADLSGDQ